MSDLLLFSPAVPADSASIEHLLDISFGIARRTKTSYRLREGSTPEAALTQVMRDADLGVIGTISYWPLAIGARGMPALLLGPLAVHPQRQNRGIGLALMRATLVDAKRLGHQLVLLVGDAPYYSKVGFSQVPKGQLLLPGPFDVARLLYLELKPGAIERAKGLVVAAYRH